MTKSPEPVEARRVHAATRMAFDADPAEFVAVRAGDRALEALWQARDKKVRRAAPAPPVDALVDADRSLGASFYEAMQHEADDNEEES